jgi:thiol-disulfide isomerase/thioredoxin
MQNLDEQRIDLNDYVGDGRWTLVMFWSLDCKPCEKQKPMIEAFYQDHKVSRANVIGVALDGPKHELEIEARIEKNKTSYRNFIAFDDVIYKQFLEEVGKPYNATPTYVLYKPDGSILGMHTGPIAREALEAVVAPQ